MKICILILLLFVYTLVILSDKFGGGAFAFELPNKRFITKWAENR